MMQSKVSSLFLLLLDGNEKTLEVSSSESFMISPLDDLIEKSRLILHRLGEDLKEISFLVIINQDLVLLKNINVFRNLDRHVR